MMRVVAAYALACVAFAQEPITVDGLPVTPHEPSGNVAVVEDSAGVRVITVGEIKSGAPVAIAVDAEGHTFDLGRGVFLQFDTGRGGYVSRSLAVLDDGTRVDLESARTLAVGPGSVAITGDQVVVDGRLVGTRGDVGGALERIGVDTGAGFHFVDAARLRVEHGMTLYVSPFDDSGIILYAR